MNAGIVRTAGKATALAVVVALVLFPGSVMAQTPPSACAADSLYLITPTAVDLRLQVDQRPGLELSWEDLDITEATCFSLSGQEDLGYSVVVEGGFGDLVDRDLRFTTSDSGSIGTALGRSLAITWRSEGLSNQTSGVLAGRINLANNGGIWEYDNNAGVWTQSNLDLPMTWRQTNIVAMAEGQNGFRLAGVTKGSTFDTDPVGLYAYDGTRWTSLADSVFNSTVRVLTIAISPTENNHFAVGTARNGLFVTRDGGDTFTQWLDNLDPDYPEMPTVFRVGALSWHGDRLMAGFTNYGLFLSSDGGQTFSRTSLMVPATLDSLNAPLEAPFVNEIAVDPGDSNRYVVALRNHGLYQSFDGGATWLDMYGDLNVPDPEEQGRWVHHALSVAVDPVNPGILVAGFEQEGLYRTDDNGVTWVRVGEDQQPDNTAVLKSFQVRAVPGHAGMYHAMEGGWALLTSMDSGVTWAPFGVQPALSTALVLLTDDGGTGNLVLGSWGGGIYATGTPLPLYETYTSGTTADLRDLDLGLEITFGPGVVQRSDVFELVCQTFQGWAVWRSPEHDRDEMTLIGLYDRVNPETCIVGYCGDYTYDPVPNCYAAKRAACFNFDTPDTIRFFDDEIYNGFGYYYAVTCFDYGNTANVTPQTNNKEMLFSPRWRGDYRSPFGGAGNRSHYKVNLESAHATHDEEIYVYPNPLRAGAGIPGREGETVVFTNLPDGSRVRVFTTAGDDVINLGPDNQTGNNIYWRTVNRENEPIAPGVYIYKVEMPQRDDYWGRLVVIR